MANERIKHRYNNPVTDAGADVTGPNEWNDNHAVYGGIATLVAGEKTVTIGATMANTDYLVQLTPSEDETVRAPIADKTTTTFKIKSGNPASTQQVHWTVLP
jgi:hypothetical protein